MKHMLAALVFCLVAITATFSNAQTIRPRGVVVKTAPVATTDDTEAAKPAAAISMQDQLDELVGKVGGVQDWTRRAGIDADKAWHLATTNTDTTKKVVVDMKKMARERERDAKTSVALWAVQGIIDVVGVIAIFLLFKRKANILPVMIFLLGMGLASHASAAEPKAKQTTTPATTCKIAGITTGEVVVKEQDPTMISIAFRNCGKVKGVSTDDAGIVFTEVKPTSAGLNAKVAAQNTALTGPVLFKITNEDDEEFSSPDSVYLLILDTQTASVRKDAAAANTKVTKQVAEVKKEVAAASKKVEAVNTLVMGKLDEAHAQALILQAVKPLEAEIVKLQGQVADLQMVVVANANNDTATSQKIGTLTEAVKGLAVGQEVLANKKAGGFWGMGKKPVDPKVAEAADRIFKEVSK